MKKDMNYHVVIIQTKTHHIYWLQKRPSPFMLSDLQQIHAKWVTQPSFPDHNVHKVTNFSLCLI